MAEPRRLSAAQHRFLAVCERYGANDEDGAEYWPVCNDWVKDKGPTNSVAFRNITRTTDALIRKGAIWIDDEGMIHLGQKAEAEAHG